MSDFFAFTKVYENMTIYYEILSSELPRNCLIDDTECSCDIYKISSTAKEIQ